MTALLLLLASLPAAAGSPPEVRGADVLTHAGDDLARTLDQLLDLPDHRPYWVGYAVAQVPGDRQLCCYSGGELAGTIVGSGDLDLGHGRAADGICRLEGESFWIINSRDQTHPAGAQFLVLMRVERRRITRVRIASSCCTLKTRGLDLHWIEEAETQESARWLNAMLEERSGDKEVAEQALVALALHDDAWAGEAIERIVRGDYPEDLRREGIFWLGSARADAGFQALRRLALDESLGAIRREVPFGLSESPVPEAIDELIRLARHDPSAEVRREALFWMADAAGRRVVGTLREAAEDDPDTEVQKAAVYALSELPDGEGVPLLIELGRTHRNREVRREAIFWLGESDDPRALAFLEEILTG